MALPVHPDLENVQLMSCHIRKHISDKSGGRNKWVMELGFLINQGRRDGFV